MKSLRDGNEKCTEEIQHKSKNLKDNRYLPDGQRYEGHSRLENSPRRVGPQRW